MRITPARLRAFGLAGTFAGLSTILLACGATQPVKLSCQAQFVDIKDGSSADYNFALHLDPAKRQGQFIPASEAAKKISEPAFQDNKLELELEPESLQVTHKTKWNQRLVLAFDRTGWPLRYLENVSSQASSMFFLWNKREDWLETFHWGDPSPTK